MYEDYGGLLWCVKCGALKIGRIVPVKSKYGGCTLIKTFYKYRKPKNIVAPHSTSYNTDITKFPELEEVINSFEGVRGDIKNKKEALYISQCLMSLNRKLRNI